MLAGNICNSLKSNKTPHVFFIQLVNHFYISPDGLWIGSASFDKSAKLLLFFEVTLGQFNRTGLGYLIVIFSYVVKVLDTACTILIC